MIEITICTLDVVTRGCFLSILRDDDNGLAAYLSVEGSSVLTLLGEVLGNVCVLLMYGAATEMCVLSNLVLVETISAVVATLFSIEVVSICIGFSTVFTMDVVNIFIGISMVVCITFFDTKYAGSILDVNDDATAFTVRPSIAISILPLVMRFLNFVTPSATLNLSDCTSFNSMSKLPHDT